MKLFHYTVGSKLQAIGDAGYLIPSPVPNRTPHERGVLWFSANPKWEPTATKPILRAGSMPMLDRESLRRAVGLYRFVWQAEVLDPSEGPEAWRLHRWPSIATKAGIREAERTAMALSGLRVGATPRDWFGRLDPLEIDDLGFQAMDEHGAWADAGLNDGVEDFNARGLRVLSAVAA